MPSKWVAPLMGAWIEILRRNATCTYAAASRPSWARGLKSNKFIDTNIEKVSRPSWARGLKLLKVFRPIPSSSVTPLMGAWIEISLLIKSPPPGTSRPSWARGLKY